MSDKKVDIKTLEIVVKILKENNLTEIEYKDDNLKIKISANAPVRINEVQNIAPQNQIPDKRPTQPEEKIADVIDFSKHPGALVSPMVGTCYLASEPGAANFVKLGDNVKKDQPLMIIEAMKVMNYIKAPKEGKIIHIAVSDAQPVEYGQLLLVIE